MVRPTYDIVSIVENRTPKPIPGWVARLTGHKFDLDEWERQLQAPFDPYCERIGEGDAAFFVLRSESFAGSETAADVMALALPLIDRLNGALSVTVRTEPLTFACVSRIDEDGKFHTSLFAAGHARGRATATAVGKAIDANGNVIPSPSPKPSAAQDYIKAAENDDDISDMLVFSGRSDSWFDIYKAIELAERLPGKGGSLWPLLGGSSDDCKRMRETANFYRHARGYRPPKLTTLAEAKPLLALIIRTVLAGRLHVTHPA
jgi:hypothetical protein